MVNSRVGSGLWRAPANILHSSEARRSHLPTQIDSLGLLSENKKIPPLCFPSLICDCLVLLSVSLMAAWPHYVNRRKFKELFCSDV